MTLLPDMPLIETDLMHPVTTQERRVAFENSQLRVEHNLVRNAATSEESLALKIAPLDDTQYMTIIVPVLPDGRLLLVGRYRYAIQRWSIEFPRACCQTHETGWRSAAEENLRKHADLKADRLRLLGVVHIDPALASIGMIVVLAAGCTGPQPKASDPAELIAGSVAVTDAELDHLVCHGEVTCGPTLAALSLYRAQRQKHVVDDPE